MINKKAYLTQRKARDSAGGAYSLRDIDA